MATFQEQRSATALTDDQLRAALAAALDRIGRPRRVAMVPPDITRLHSFAGRITELVWEHWGDRVADVLPALGTHAAMTGEELSAMFGRVPHGLFREHRWKEDVETLGRIPAARLRELSEGRVDFDWPAQTNRLLLHGGHDLILCVGQVVPHEVVGMAGQSKNVCSSARAAREAIHKSHYLGAVYGMERIMGRPRNPVRALFEVGRAPLRLAAPHGVRAHGGGGGRGRCAGAARPLRRRRRRDLRQRRGDGPGGQPHAARRAAAKGGGVPRPEASSRAPGSATRPSTGRAWPWPTGAS